MSKFASFEQNADREGRLMEARTRTKITRISIDDVRKKLNEVVFVDARSATALSRNPLQVPGAIHAPIKDIDKAVKSVPPKRTIVTYCT